MWSAFMPVPSAENAKSAIAAAKAAFPASSPFGHSRAPFDPEEDRRRDPCPQGGARKTARAGREQDAAEAIGETIHAAQIFDFFAGEVLPGSGWIATARDLAFIDRLWRQWSPGFSLDPALKAELHEHLRRACPRLKYYRAMLRYVGLPANHS